MSTTVETEHPEAELQPGLALLGPVLEKFVEVKDIYGPTDDGKAYDIQSPCFVCSYCAGMVPLLPLDMMHRHTLRQRLMTSWTSITESLERSASL